jgi:molybdopterin converting factor small subunit
MSWYFVTARPMTAAIFDGVGRWTLPHQLEGDRVVMFYDSSITDPQGDLEKMDAFIKSEEEYLGVTMPAKIHWIRAVPLGMEIGLAVGAVSMASPESNRAGEKRIGVIDYHEAAHNIIPNRSASSVYAGHWPPTFLVEGWAESRSSSWETLAEQCWELKQSNRALTLREAVSDTYYNQIDYRLYQHAGALVTVLCDKFGPEKFLELYTNCTRKTFEQDVKRIYGLSFEELDSLYWDEIETQRNAGRSFEKAAENCTPEEKALLEEFRAAYLRQVDNFYRWTENGTLEAVVRHSYRGPDRNIDGQREILFQAREGQLLRAYRKDTGTQTEASGENAEKVQWEGITCDLLLPEERLYTYQHSNDKDDPSELIQRSKVASPERAQQEFRRHHLRAFQPFSLLETMSGHWFTYPDDYLWEPPLGTIIQSVVVEGIPGNAGILPARGRLEACGPRCRQDACVPRGVIIFYPF